MDFSLLNLAVDGDSITVGDQWSYYLHKTLHFKSHYNVSVGSASWNKRRVEVDGKIIETQNYLSLDFKGVSDGWEKTNDTIELQKRMNNCAIIHTQKYIDDVKNKLTDIPDIFIYSMGTNDEEDYLGNAEKELSLPYNKTNLFTEVGATCWCLDTIKNEFPNVKIYMMTPIQSAKEEHNRKILKTIENMKKICNDRKITLIDCFDKSGIERKYENPDAEGRYLIDGLHPKKNGQELMGKLVCEVIRNDFR